MNVLNGEWGQVFIFDSLAKHIPAFGREAEGIIERVTPQLQHANSAVVMSAGKVILCYFELMGSANSDSIRHLARKLALPLGEFLGDKSCHDMNFKGRILLPSHALFLL